MRRGPIRLAVAALLALAGGAAQASETCLAAPYTGGSGEVADLAMRLTDALSPHPSLAKALMAQAPDLCLDDTIYEEQGYFEPRANRIVLRAGLDPDLQLAILIHEVRHLDQFDRGVCPSTALILSEYLRGRLALEADAAAIGVYVAWTLKENGTPGPLERLRSWPTHEDLVARFTDEMTASGDEVAATAATFAQWFENSDRQAMYAFAICSNYLDALDRQKVEPGNQTLPDDLAAQICLLPDGRRYDCVLPP
ncbi:MAG: hypothetical protein LPJ93_01145 [Rhodobacterales bacterium]|nr:hypothetical protein [Rhodobacterales bacterium]